MMKSGIRFPFFVIVTIFILILSLMNAAIVFADDGTPSEPTAEPAVEEPVAPETVSEILEQLPEETEVVVLDEEGQPLPLGSEEAAEIIAVVDPMWCPVGILPGGVGCTTEFATGQALINSMDTSNPGSAVSIYEADGIIYFTATSGGSFLLVPGGPNNNIAIFGGNALYEPDYNAIKGFNLTLQGGWNGSTVAPTISGQTSFGTDRIQIGTSANPWVGNITINDMITNGNGLTCIFSACSGVTVYTTSGDIALNNVDVMEQRSLILSNHTALLDSTDGNITVQGSSFDGDNTGLDHGDGFSAQTDTGSITISDTSFSDARGLILDFNGATLSGVDVTLTNVSTTGNDNYGIEINASGDITVDGLFADGNNESGVYLDNSNGDADDVIEITNSQSNNNGSYGFEVYSLGNITLNGVMAGNNSSSGAYLDNGCGCTISDISVSSSDFSDNGDDGLDVFSNGEITLINVTANRNFFAGAMLHNDFVSVAGVTVSDSEFTENGFGGVGVFSNGDVLLDNVTASQNVSGAGLFASGTVTVICGTYANNTDNGMDTETPTLILNGVNFSGNPVDYYYTGVVLVNPDGCNPSGGSTKSSVIIPVTGGEPITCAVSQTSVKIMLPNGNFVTLACPINEYAIVDQMLQEGLPAPLEDGIEFISATTALVILENQPVESLKDPMVVSFLIPDGMEDAELAILFWDGSQWLELEGKFSEDGTYFEATTNLVGTFVFVTK